MNEKKYCIIVNPYAQGGKAQKLIPMLKKELEKLSVQFYFVLTKDVVQAQQVAKAAIKNNEIVTVVGGDGSARAVAEIVSRERGTLAIIPAGRGNDLARTFNIPIQPKLACRVLATGKIITIDIGFVNQQAFLGICSVGLDSLASQIAEQTAFIKGKLVYFYAGVKALLKWKMPKFTVTIDDITHEYFGYIASVANSKAYGGGMILAPTASIQDGQLDIVFIKNVSKWNLFINLIKVYKGAHTKACGFSILPGKNVLIKISDPTIPIYADGDFIGMPPAKIEILPQALRVVVAERFPALSKPQNF